jgi:uncharacterized protein YyaL (SSP411 family)
MYNPVDWHAWGPEALELASREDKPLFLSIGYSACHWCHVMEHESFEDEATAALMNRHFVNIKVDREERPDIDQVYMDAVTGLTGHGGWPLSVFCTPDGRPFYGGTYFPPEPRHGLPSFRELLARVENAYRTRRAEIDESAERIRSFLDQRPTGTAGGAPGIASAATGAMHLLQRADPEHGGFGDAPKFPTPTYLDLLLAAGDVLPERKSREALDHVLLTCHEMARRGVYDQIAGGFHRYSVDGHWGVPHFEKMLYDQGQLLRVYAEAWRRSGASDPELLWPVRETADYLRREMLAPDGGYFASQDADSEGEEGRFYVWTPEQIDAVLGPERGAAFRHAYAVTPGGNFEGGATVLADVAREPRERFAQERAELLTARAKRIAPDTDRKRVAAWNGLAISGLARAAIIPDGAPLLRDAVAAADFALEHMIDPDGRLLRVFDGERAHITAFLDDHAAMLEAMLDLYRAGAGERYLAAGLRFAAEIVARFYDAKQCDFFLTPSDGEPLVHRPRSDHDGATPHSTGLATLGLLRAASVSGRTDLAEVARSVLRSHAVELERSPEAFPTLARAALAAERGLSMAVIVGEEDASATHALADRARLVLAPEDGVAIARPCGPPPAGVDPDWFLGRLEASDRPTAYVCRGVACSLPVVDPGAMESLPTERGSHAEAS